MKRVHVNGVELEYDVHGSGEPVLLVHGGLLADENTPLALEPALTDQYMVINYHRRGFAGSGADMRRTEVLIWKELIELRRDPRLFSRGSLFWC